MKSITYMLTNRTSYCYIEDIVILQILQYITSTLSLEHVKQNHCTVVTAKAKGNSLLLNIWDDDIIYVRHRRFFIFPVVGCISKMPVRWKIDIFWQAFRMVPWYICCYHKVKSIIN